MLNATLLTLRHLAQWSSCVCGGGRRAKCAVGSGTRTIPKPRRRKPGEGFLFDTFPERRLRIKRNGAWQVRAQHLPQRFTGAEFVFISGAPGIRIVTGIPAVRPPVLRRVSKARKSVIFWRATNRRGVCAQGMARAEINLLFSPWPVAAGRDATNLVTAIADARIPFR